MGTLHAVSNFCRCWVYDAAVDEAPPPAGLLILLVLPVLEEEEKEEWLLNNVRYAEEEEEEKEEEREGVAPTIASHQRSFRGAIISPPRYF